MSLNLFTIKFPITAISSILHRISGVLIFLMIPIAIWLLQQSLKSEISFSSVKTLLTSDCGKVMSWISISAFFYHVIAGTRHLITDLGFFENKCSGKIGAYLVIISAIITSSILGKYLW